MRRLWDGKIESLLAEAEQTFTRASRVAPLSGSAGLRPRCSLAKTPVASQQISLRLRRIQYQSRQPEGIQSRLCALCLSWCLRPCADRLRSRSQAAERSELLECPASPHFGRFGPFALRSKFQPFVHLLTEDVV